VHETGRGRVCVCRPERAPPAAVVGAAAVHAAGHPPDPPLNPTTTRTPFKHAPLQLRRWADVLVIAPLSANTLAKLAHGLADGLLTCVARAWELRAGGGGGGGGGGAAPPPAAKPLLVAPAMNTAMWEHPATGAQLATLGAWGVAVVPPVAGALACGDTGCGALAAVADIAAAVFASLNGGEAREEEPPAAGVGAPGAAAGSAPAPLTAALDCGGQSGAPGVPSSLSIVPVVAEALT
jgi:hypothetical protein